MTALPPHSPPTQPGPVTAPARPEPLAIASLILGVAIVAFGAVSGIAAVVCGFLALNRIKRDPTRAGSGMAIAGIVLGFISGIMTGLFVAMLLMLWSATASNTFGTGGNAGPPQPIDMYYYDVGSDAADPLDRLFIAGSNEFPPIAAPSGRVINGQPAGVRAWVWSCGDCSDDSKRFVGYLETFTPEAKRPMQAPPPDQSGGPLQIEDIMARDNGHLIAKPEKPAAWVPYTSPEGTSIIQAIMNRCGGAPPRPCYPADE